MNKRKGLFIGVAVFTWVQIILVLLVDCTFFAWLSKLRSGILDFSHGDGPFIKAVVYFLLIQKDNVLLAWSIAHLVFHVAWIASSSVLFAFALKRNTKTSKHVIQFAIVTILVCICDIGACIHTSVVATKPDGVEVITGAPKIFFPLFYSKGGLFWMYNVAVAVLMVDVVLKMRAKKKRNNSIKQEIIHHNSNFKEPVEREREREPPVLMNYPSQYQYQYNPYNKNELVDNYSYNHNSAMSVISDITVIPASPASPPPSEIRQSFNYGVTLSKPLALSHFQVPVPEPDY